MISDSVLVTHDIYNEIISDYLFELYPLASCQFIAHILKGHYGVTFNLACIAVYHLYHFLKHFTLIDKLFEVESEIIDHSECHEAHFVYQILIKSILSSVCFSIFQQQLFTYSLNEVNLLLGKLLTYNAFL